MGFKKIPEDLYKFAYVSPKWFEVLYQKAKKENWDLKTTDSTTPHPVLFTYIVFTFKRLAELYNKSNGQENWIVFKGNKAIINTGLQTDDYRRIYMAFKTASEQNTYMYYCYGVFEEHSIDIMNFSDLPRKAEYFSSLADLLYNPNLPLVANTKHILGDPRNVDRLPESLKNSPLLLNTFEGALEIMKRKVEQNYRTAIPQYHDGRIQLLLPICLQDTETPDLVLVVSRVKNSYRGNTCLTLDMAYNNARLLAKPENNWLAR